MNASEATRFFDTSGCLNLTRPTTGTSMVSSSNQRKQRMSSSIPIRGQLKIDLYNFDHVDFSHSKYVLTSPRSLEACARLNIKPMTLLPKRLADVQDDIGSEKVRLATLANVRDQMEIDRLANLQRCREEREKIIREEALVSLSSTKVVDPQPSFVNDGSIPLRIYDTKFNPSNSLISGLHQATTINTVPMSLQPTTTVQFSNYNTDSQLPPRPTSSNRSTYGHSILKSSSTSRRPQQLTYYEEDDRDYQYRLRPSSSTSFVDDVKRLNKSFQRVTLTENRLKQNKDERYMNNLENVKEMIERRATHSVRENDPELAAFEKKQYEILLGHYDHELKIQKTLENARRTEKEKQLENYETLLNSLNDHSMAEERRENELRRKVGKLHHSRQLYETIQAKNYEQQLTDLQRRRYELLNDIKRKDRRTRSFIQDKEDAANLSRSLAKSSQDLREYIRDTNENFNERAQKAELTSSILVKRTKVPVNRRQLQTSLRS